MIVWIRFECWRNEREGNNKEYWHRQHCFNNECLLELFSSKIYGLVEVVVCAKNNTLTCKYLFQSGEVSLHKYIEILISCCTGRCTSKNQVLTIFVGNWQIIFKLLYFDLLIFNLEYFSQLWGLFWLHWVHKNCRQN